MCFTNCHQRTKDLIWILVNDKYNKGKSKLDWSEDNAPADDEDEDIGYEKREKSTLSIVIIIGDGVDEQVAGGPNWGPRGKRRRKGPVQPAKAPLKTTSTGDTAMDTT